MAYAAEGGAGAILAQLADAFLEDGLLEDGELASVQPPEMEGFSFSRTNVRKIGGVVIETVSDGPLAGLYSLNIQHIEITSEDGSLGQHERRLVVAAKNYPRFLVELVQPDAQARRSPGVHPHQPAHCRNVERPPLPPASAKLELRSEV